MISLLYEAFFSNSVFSSNFCLPSIYSDGYTYTRIKKSFSITVVITANLVRVIFSTLLAGLFCLGSFTPQQCNLPHRIIFTSYLLHWIPLKSRNLLASLFRRDAKNLKLLINLTKNFFVLLQCLYWPPPLA